MPDWSLQFDYLTVQELVHLLCFVFYHEALRSCHEAQDGVCHLPTAGVLEVDLPPSGSIRSARIWEYRWLMLRNWQKIVLATNGNNRMLRPNSSHHDNNDDDSCSNLSAADSGNTSADWLTKHWVADVVSISKFRSITYSLKNNTCNRQQQSATKLRTINKNILDEGSLQEQIFARWRKRFCIKLGPLCESSSPLSQQGLHPISRDQLNSRFHGCAIFREIDLLP